MADKAKSDRPKFATVELEEPIERGDEKITTLTLRRPDSGSLRGLSLLDCVKMETAAIATLVPRISSPPLIAEEVAQLDPADLFACGEKIAGFFMTRAERAAAFPTT